MNVKKLSKRLLSLLIVAVMLLGVCSPIVSAAGNMKDLHKDKAGDGTLHYVSLGASNTNGYGHHGYLDDDIYEDPLAAPKAEMNDYGYDKAPANAYPALIRDALAVKTGRDVELHQLAISSMRVEEVLWLLDDTFQPDEYMDWRFTGGKSWFDMAHKEGGREALRVEYRDYIANADVITVDLGWNNFGVYAFNNIMTILKENGARYWNAPAFDRVIDAGMEEEYYAIKDKVIERLDEFVDLSDTALSDDVISMLADVLAYATFGACYNFDKVMGKIYALNPDADVVVINIQNLADELVVNLDGTELPLGDLYGELIEFVDLYRATMSPYADRYGFAYAGEDGDVDTFLDEFRLWDGDPATLSQDMRDLFDMYDDNLYVRSKIEYIMVGQVFAQIFAGLRSTATSYGLSAFVNDDKYTYEIPAFDMSWLDNIDLATLDFKNPDTGIEIYGAALAPHLVNLRNYEGEGKNAYNYVFDNIVKNLAGIATLDDAIAQRDAILETLPPEQQANYAQLIQYVTILEGARNEFNNAFFALNMVYNNTLNYAYDTVGTIIQYSLQFNTFYMTPDSMANHNDKTDELLGYVVNTFTNNTMLKFYEELGKIGLDDSGAVAPEITVNEELFSDPLIQAVCALEVRYDFGNSFFAHPSVKGNQQIRDAVMDVLENGSHANVFADKKINQYLDLFEDLLNPYYEEKYAELKANGTIDAMLDGLDAIEGVMDIFEDVLLNSEIPDNLDIDHTTAENIKALLLEEIGNLNVTLVGLRDILAVETLEFTTSDFAKLAALQRNLENHANTISALAEQVGIFAEPYINEVVRVTVLYAGIIADVTENSYNYLVNGIEEFHEEYLAFVELVGSYVDKIDTDLGAAVRAYLLDTPADALRIIAEYRDEAVLKFIVDAASTSEKLYSSIAAIVAILAEHGADIYGEISADEEYQYLVSAIKAELAALYELYNSINESPLVAVVDIDLVIAAHRAEIEDLYTRLFALVVRNVEEYDEKVAELLWTALTDTAKALGIITEVSVDYTVWLDGHIDAMLGALVHSFIENSDEFVVATDAVIWKYINNITSIIVDTYNDIKLQINLQIAIVEGKLEELKNLGISGIEELKNRIDCIRSRLEAGIDDIEALVAEIKGLIDEIKALIDGLETPDEALADILDSLKRIDDLLEVVFGRVYGELKDVLNELALDLLDRTLDCLKKNAPYIDEQLYNYFYNNPEEVIEFFKTYGPYIEKIVDKYGDEMLSVIGYLLYKYGDDLVIYIIENPEDAFENIVYWYNAYGVRIWPMVKVYLDVLGIEFTMDDAEAILRNLCDVIKDLGLETLDEILALIEAKIEYLENLTDEQKLAIKNEINAFLTTITERIIEAIGDALNGEYTPNDNSYYVAITGNDAKYAEMLAFALGLGDKYSVMGWDNIDESVLNKADFVTLGYDRTQISGFALDQFLAAVAAYGNDSLREQVAAYLEINNVPDELANSIDDAIVSALERPEFAGKTIANLDWSKLVGEENVALIEAILADVADYLVENGIDGDYVLSVNVVEIVDKYLPDEGVSIDIFDNNPIFELTVPVADIVMIAVESYIYANIMFNMEYADVILGLVENNPDVAIAVLGQYNPFNDITVEGITIPLAEIYGKIMALSDINSFVYALTLPNVTYIDISKAQSTWNTIDDPLEFLQAYLRNPEGDVLTDDSNLYVMNQILSAYGLTCKHYYESCTDMRCNICGEIRSGVAHKYNAVVTQPDCVNGGFTTYTCSVCGHSYVDNKTDALGHKYDNACDADCNVCGEQRIPADHQFGDWVVVLEPTYEAEGREEQVCSVCGFVSERAIPKLVEEDDDKLTAGEMAAIVCGIIVITFGVGAAIAFTIKKRRIKKTK